MNTQVKRGILALAVALCPAFITLGLVHFYLGGSLDNFIPSYQGEMNDAMHNWREIYTFAQVGFKGGYYTVNEIPARIGFTHYYAYGPVYPMIMGLLGRVVGWLPASPPIFNMVLLTVTLFVVLLWLHFDNRQLLYVALLIVTFWPLLLYIPSNMMETLNHVFALALAVLFYHTIRRSGPVSIPLVIVGVVLILFVSLFRTTWVLLMLPFLLLTLRNGSRQRVWIAGLIALVLIAAVEISTLFLNAPFPLEDNNPGTFLANLSKFGVSAFSMAGSAVILNLFRYFIGVPLEFAERISMVVLLIYLLALVLRRMRKRGLGGRELSSSETLVHLLNLGLGIGVLTFLYSLSSLWADYRLLAPPLLLSLVLFIAFRRYRLVLVVSLLNVLVVFSFFDVYKDLWSSQFTFDRQAVTTFQAATQPFLTYDPQATNAWCNTVLTRIAKQDAFRFPPELFLSAPGGIGISYYLDILPEGLALPPRSKYLLLTDDAYHLIADKLHVQPLVRTSVGTLYLNLDSGCGSGTPGSS